ncbi:hypothetical protein Tco_1248437 [Tanacetum coccineum]
MNYQPISAVNKTNGNAGLETNSDAGQAEKKNVPDQEYILLPLLHTSSNVPSNSEKVESPPKDDAGKMNEVRDLAKDGNMNGPGEAINTDRTNRLNTVSSSFNTVKGDLNNLETNMSVSPIPITRIHKDHPKAQIIGEMEPKKVTQALDDESWVEAMQEE